VGCASFGKSVPESISLRRKAPHWLEEAGEAWACVFFAPIAGSAKRCSPRARSLAIYENELVGAILLLKYERLAPLGRVVCGEACGVGAKPGRKNGSRFSSSSTVAQSAAEAARR